MANDDPKPAPKRNSRPRVAVVIGTRPEGIKLAPVIRELQRHADRVDTLVVSTAQHHTMLDDALAFFGIEPDIKLDLMHPGQSLATLASRALAKLDEVFAEQAPDIVLVQGDTTTVTAASLAGFYRGITVGHVEAGLRSFDRSRPFPEEMNRKVAGCIAGLHFAPTEKARCNLLSEGVAPETIFVTGNTVVDALKSVDLSRDSEHGSIAGLLASVSRLILVTAHRRESQGPALTSICKAVKRLVSQFPDVEVVYPVHPNPSVSRIVHDQLAQQPRIHLLEPLAYPDLLRLLKHCVLILTDSGGIQEEAPCFGTPVLVLREVTERPELVDAGVGKLVGTDASTIVAEASRLLQSEKAYRAMSSLKHPFGDGHAAERIVRILLGHLGAQPS